MKGMKVKKQNIRYIIKDYKAYFDNSFFPLHFDDYVIFPLKKEPLESNLFDIVDVSFKRKKQDMKQALKEILSEEELNNLISSFEVVGDVIILQIPEVLNSKKHQIAQIVLDNNPSINAIYQKTGGRSGDFRIMPVEFLAGNPHTEVLHKENKVLLNLDFSKAYFSSRLANERERVYSELFGKVLVMFSGIGPYSVETAKHRSKFVYGIELNPDAHKYALRNQRINRLSNLLSFQGDVRTVIPNLSSYILGKKVTLDSFSLIDDFSSFVDSLSFPQTIELQLKDINEFYDNEEIIENLLDKFNIIFNFVKESESILRLSHKKKIRVLIKSPQLFKSKFIKKALAYFLINNHDSKTNLDLTNNSLNQLPKVKALNIKTEDDLKLLNKLDFVHYIRIINPEVNLDLNKINLNKIGFGIVDMPEEIPEEISQKVVSKLTNTLYFDNILMPLPKSASLFLSTALVVAKTTNIYLYDFIDINNLDDEKKRIQSLISRAGFKSNIEYMRKAGSFSPGVYRMLVKIKVWKNKN